ncbi:DUF3397 family protein [Lactobacillus sp. CRM56-3]|uniref:DUF3397 family protein n=1 Tax=Secundilactobacillus folii TaxID=2678357 RepID=A0A7X3C3V8_9LACO|nr:DUF3397 family protein [Secundilactobacillus folii]MTV82922.1 DUF3397 family protein [Secundilactobacillus folii]
MIQVLFQILILIIVMVVLRIFRHTIAGVSQLRLLPVDISPFFLLWFMWQLSHTWPDPWFASIIFIWMLISIVITLWWGFSKGELLWNKFLIFYWRLSIIILYLGYAATIISLLLRA